VYTQCSKCETVFKISADVLRAAGGQVRCGRCGEVFNALARLAEDPTAFSAGESPLEMETRADSILESVAALQVVQAVAKDHEDFGPPDEEFVSPDEEFVPPGVEIAHLEILDVEAEDNDRSMEFTLPPGELDRIFVESKKRVLPMPAAASASAPSEAEVEPAPHPESVAVVDAPPAHDRVSGGFEAPEDVPRHTLAGYGAQRRLIMWLGAALVSALLLIAQVAHQNREWFVAHAHGPFGAGVRALYGAMGAPLPAPANLSAYQLRQWGVTGDPDANGTLRVRASILNTAAQLQPYPLLRVTLADRFGKSIGARDFEPAEYLGKPTARLLTPGERADATLEILDPGKNAEGFEVDVCLRGVDRRISCANDVAPQATR
jgi:predicted Zn finger-like uncharacterized protein